MKDLLLQAVTPERSILAETSVEAIVLPGAMGQLTLLPGHINFITSLRHGTFGYRVNGEWQVAYLKGGFTQVYNGKVTVLAETLEMAAELDVAKAEADLGELQQKLRAAKVTTPEYASIEAQRDLAQARLKAAQRKIH
jgi:F-type H+-transporting ATPase subunit epsilon